ncbi:uncharacterized protein NEMAJ01_0483 [Nematocida major]|uniref:uncharacterized protein n=1 Tax=Nematocida major TaxID=1912982 RepID=UPI0020072B18|nr:uncharacterized protein NEMAJ01_0483 [Nematocida major]KAH9385587.1 hypothetical protein NEMAJ01_0483 [Nematocida major]
MKCPYCGCAKMQVLSGTVYCGECQSYFRVSDDGYVPIFIENKTVYRKYQKVPERRILCSACQERNEAEGERIKAEEEQNMRMRRSVKRQNLSELCRECVCKVNEKLESDDRKFTRPYRTFLQRRKLALFGILVLSAGVYWGACRWLGALILMGGATWEARSNARRVCVWALCGFRWGVWILWGEIMWKLCTWKLQEVTRLRVTVDVEKIQKDILRKVKSLKLLEGPREEKAPERSFLHRAYSQHLRAGEEVEALAKGISGLQIRDTWYRKVDRIVEWLAA